MGSYVNKNLISQELEIYEARNHWLYFFAHPIAYLFKSNEYVLTNKRVVVKEGIISRRSVEMNLSKIESINVDQTILGRILGYGTFTIIGSGGTRETFFYVSSHLKIRRTFQEVVSQTE